MAILGAAEKIGAAKKVLSVLGPRPAPSATPNLAHSESEKMPISLRFLYRRRQKCHFNHRNARFDNTFHSKFKFWR